MAELASNSMVTIDGNVVVTMENGGPDPQILGYSNRGVSTEDDDENDVSYEVKDCTIRYGVKSCLVIKDVTVEIGGKVILDKISGMAKEGETLAIMGPSGAGKSTLLNVLGGRCPPTSGHVIFDGEPVTRKLRRKISYVLQDDVFYPNLTLRETLTFAALLRLPDKMPRDLKIQRVQEIVTALELNKCIDTKIGNAFIKGLSGGERKRASIACELIKNPRLIILDEPTSGLDSAISFSLMSTLSRYAKESNKTVVTTIHQPSSQVFYMFSNVLLIADGQVAYYGPASKVLEYFSGIGLNCQPHYNPADFILEQVKSTPETVKKIFSAAKALREKTNAAAESSAQVDSRRTLEERNNQQNLKSTRTEAENSIDKYVVENAKWPTSFLTQYLVLTQRCLLRSKNRYLCKYRIGQMLFVALIVSVIWWQTDRSEETSRDRLGILFFILAFNLFLAMMDGIFCVYDADGVFVRERASGIYRLSAYYLATSTSEIPATFIIPGIFTIICYWTTGLERDARCFFGHVFLVLLGTFTAQGVGIFMGVLVRDKLLSTTAAQCFMLASMLAAGFYNAHLATWISWIKYLSYLMYPFFSMVKVEFQYASGFDCNDPTTTSFPEYCSPLSRLNGSTPQPITANLTSTGGLSTTLTPPTNLQVPGFAFVKGWNMDVLPIFVLIIISLIILFGFRLAAYIVLRLTGPTGISVSIPTPCCFKSKDRYEVKESDE